MDLPSILPKIDLARFGAMNGALIAWATMLAVILLFLLIAALVSRHASLRQRRADAAAALVPEHLIMSPAERARLRGEAAELIRQAAATAAAAKRAQAAVQESHARAAAAHRAREAAWAAFDEAQRSYEEARREINRSTAEKVGGDNKADGGNTAAEGDDAGRDVSRAALAAFRRGDISVDQLNAVFRQTSGWDPVLELQAREVELRRSAERRARRLFQAAAAAERTANHTVDVAVVAAHALAEEAAELAVEASAMRETLNAAVRFAATPQRQRKGTTKKRQRLLHQHANPVATVG